MTTPYLLIAVSRCLNLHHDWLQIKIKKLEHEAREAVARTEAQMVEREDLENRLAEAEVRAEAQTVPC